MSIRRSLDASHVYCGYIGPCSQHLVFSHEPGFDQVVQDHVGASTRCGQVDVRGMTCRRLDQADQHSSFREGHIARRLIEVEARGAIDAEGVTAHIDTVQVKSQDFIFGQVPFEPDRKQYFFDLVSDAAVGVRKQSPGKLQGDRGAILVNAVVLCFCKSVESTWEIDVETFVEVAVLGCERDLDQRVGKILKRGRNAAADVAATNRVAKLIKQTCRDLASLQLLEGSANAGDRKRQQQDQSTKNEGQGFGNGLKKQPALPPAETDAIYESRVAAI